MPKLGVNIDHVATLRQARKGVDPEPVAAGKVCKDAGADVLVVHLRQDRRHIQEEDVRDLRKRVKLPLHVEAADTPEMLRIMKAVRPDSVCLVPENPKEITTTGGLRLTPAVLRSLEKTISGYHRAGIEVSLFIDPEALSVRMAKSVGADTVELCTLAYARALGAKTLAKELERLQLASYLAKELKLHLHAGHALGYHNVRPVAEIPGMEVLNIGFSVVARSMFVGLSRAVAEMRKLVN